MPANTLQRVVLADGTTGQDTQSPSTYVLASNVASLAAGANTAPVIVLRSGTYGWSYIFGGTTPSLALQTLGPDGVTWQTVATVTASGQQSLALFAGSAGQQVRLLNAGANPITGLSSALSN